MKTTTKRLEILWQNTHVTFVQSEQENKRLCIEWQANVAFRVLLCYFFLVYLCVCATDQVTVHAIHAQRWSHSRGNVSADFLNVSFSLLSMYSSAMSHHHRVFWSLWHTQCTIATFSYCVAVSIFAKPQIRGCDRHNQRRFYATSFF